MMLIEYHYFQMIGFYSTIILSLLINLHLADFNKIKMIPMINCEITIFWTVTTVSIVCYFFVYFYCCYYSQ